MGTEVKFKVGDRVIAETDPSIHRPVHYTKYAIEPIEFIMKNGLDFETGNVVKYVLRWKDKDGVRDLKKAKRYIEMMIEKAEGNTEFAK